MSGGSCARARVPGTAEATVRRGCTCMGVPARPQALPRPPAPLDRRPRRSQRHVPGSSNDVPIAWSARGNMAIAAGPGPLLGHLDGGEDALSGLVRELHEPLSRRANDRRAGQVQPARLGEQRCPLPSTIRRFPGVAGRCTSATAMGSQARRASENQLALVPQATTSRTQKVKASCSMYFIHHYWCSGSGVPGRT